VGGRGSEEIPTDDPAKVFCVLVGSEIGSCSWCGPMMPQAKRGAGREQHKTMGLPFPGGAETDRTRELAAIRLPAPGNVLHDDARIAGDVSPADVVWATSRANNKS